MTFILTLICVTFFIFGTYRVLCYALCAPPKRTLGAIRHPHGVPDFDTQLRTVFKPVTALIMKLFPMSDYKRNRMEQDFERLDMHISPQEFVAAALARSLLLAVLGLVFIPLGIPWMCMITVIAGILQYFRSDQAIRRKIEKLNRHIEADLPRMVEAMEWTLPGNRDLIAFFTRYRKSANKAMGRELDILLTDMQISNQEMALRRMESRIASPNVSALMMILYGVDQGADQRTSLSILVKDLHAKERELLRRDMEKRPSRIKRASFILTMLMILLFMVPLVLMIVDTLTGVGF